MNNFQTIKKVVDFDELYPGRFLKSGEFKGKKVTLTIKDVVTDELEDAVAGKKRKGIVLFQETERQLVLNKTNGLCIRAMFGRHVPDWIGKRITLFPMPYQGDTAIRVWGSPDIDNDIEATIALPRKKPFTMPMHAVKSKKETPPENIADPAYDPDDTEHEQDAEFGYDNGNAGVVYE